MRTSEQIIKEAINNSEVKDYSLLEIHLRLVIKQVLIMYHNNQITKEQAKIAKEQAIKQYEDNYLQYEFEQELFKRHLKNIKKTENLRIKLRKQLKEDTELSEILITTLELIELYSGEEFK